MGSYYLKKLKNQKWSLYHQSYSAGKRSQERVSDLALLDFGLRPDDGYIKAYDVVKQLNKSQSKEKETIRKAAKRAEEFISLNEDLFPQVLIAEFKDKLSEENFGTEDHLQKLLSHFNFIQKMCIKLKLDPSAYKENSKKMYKWFIQEKISVSYSSRIISLLNRWGAFVSRKRNFYYEAVPIPRGNQQSAIADAQRTKRGTNTEFGVRTESLPLTPAILQSAKKFLSPENFRWAFLSIAWGLRPEEVDSLKDQSKFRIEEVSKDKKKIKVLVIYQSKLKSVAKEKRWKRIPVLFPDQIESLAFLSDPDSFKRPLNKTVRKYCGKGITLYGGRKNFIDMMLNRGQKLEDISSWLGHASLDTSWSRYRNKNLVNFVETAEIKKIIG